MKKIISAVIAFLLGFLVWNMATVDTTEQHKSDTEGERWVILIHGVLSSPLSMLKIENALKDSGYKTINFEYSSRKEPIDTVISRLHKEITGISGTGKNIGSINFVTHSFGGIIVRHYLEKHEVDNLGRFVMIAPPNKGSEWSSILLEIPFFDWLLGSASQNLKPEDISISPPPCEFGIISGKSGLETGFNPLLDGDNDGTVTVEETRLEGMKDFIVITGQHTVLLGLDKTVKNVLAFLETGNFIEK